MNRCEDYPCCGHGPPPQGDGGGCPDEQGRFDCVLCHATMPVGAHSAMCDDCREERRWAWDEDYEMGDAPRDGLPEEGW